VQHFETLPKKNKEDLSNDSMETLFLPLVVTTYVTACFVATFLVVFYCLFLLDSAPRRGKRERPDVDYI
jgi:hypothetical protein